MEKARYLIDFSHKRAQQTSYQPDTFHGIA